jgi:hypothetical protein
VGVSHGQSSVHRARFCLSNEKKIVQEKEKMKMGNNPDGE